MFDLSLDTEDDGKTELSVTPSQLKMLIQTNDWRFVYIPGFDHLGLLSYWEIVNIHGFPIGTCIKGD